jgi:hypothetical protein
VSRGLGYLQRYLFSMLLNAGKPMTFAEIRRIAKPHENGYDPHLERSIRRTLKKLVDDRTVIPLGRGGPGDPHRYCIHPQFLPDADRVAEVMEHLEPEGFYLDSKGVLSIRLHAPNTHLLQTA